MPRRRTQISPHLDYADLSQQYVEGFEIIRTESHVKAETLQPQTFQKALFSLNETYQLASRLFGTAIRNDISGV